MNRHNWSAQWLLYMLVLALAGCSPAPKPVESPSLVDKAGAEATAVLQRAEATAIVLRAQSTAAAMIANARGAEAAQATPTATRAASALAPDSVPVLSASPVPSPAAQPIAETANPSVPIELVGVGFGADGDFIVVNYMADPATARQKIQQMYVSVTDEATGVVYREVPVMPLLGPLIAHPIQDGQAGYVMLVNMGRTLQPGALVTVVLGDFKQEHVTVN